MSTHRGRQFTLLFGLFALLTTAPTRADDPEVRKGLQAIYDEYVQSFLAKDPGPLRRWYERYLSADVIEIGTLNQRQTRQQILDQTRQAEKVWPLALESTGKIEQITMRDGEAIVVFSQRVLQPVSVPSGDPASPPIRRKVVVLMKGRDTWVKQPDGWKCTLSVNLSVQATMDGKPLPVPGSTPPGQGTADGKPGR